MGSKVSKPSETQKKKSDTSILTIQKVSDYLISTVGDLNSGRSIFCGGLHPDNVSWLLNNNAVTMEGQELKPRHDYEYFVSKNGRAVVGYPKEYVERLRLEKKQSGIAIQGSTTITKQSEDLPTGT